MSETIRERVVRLVKEMRARTTDRGCTPAEAAGFAAKVAVVSLATRNRRQSVVKASRYMIALPKGKPADPLPDQRASLRNPSAAFYTG